jgi:hypothetical protein
MHIAIVYQTLHWPPGNTAYGLLWHCTEIEDAYLPTEPGHTDCAWLVPTWQPPTPEPEGLAIWAWNLRSAGAAGAVGAIERDIEDCLAPSAAQSPFDITDCIRLVA